MCSAHRQEPQSSVDWIQVTPVRLLPAGTKGAERWIAKLPPDEVSLALRIGSGEAQVRFIQCRIVLRLLLGRLIGEEWYSRPFEYESGGKPALPAESPVGFNLAHSGDLAVFALSHSSRNPFQVGVDVERLRPRPGGMDLARRFFHPDECAHLGSLPGHRREAEFLRIWVRKEACLKAVGAGIAGNLASFSAIEVSGRILLHGNDAVWFQELGIGIPAAAALASNRPLPLVSVAPLQTSRHWFEHLSGQDQNAGG
ncbi:MAG: 4'-phosphopantetheinyl transferase family protein [Terracidiphilus sp.]